MQLGDFLISYYFDYETKHVSTTITPDEDDNHKKVQVCMMCCVPNLLLLLLHLHNVRLLAFNYMLDLMVQIMLIQGVSLLKQCLFHNERPQQLRKQRDIFIINVKVWTRMLGDLHYQNGPTENHCFLGFGKSTETRQQKQVNIFQQREVCMGFSVK